MAESDGTVDHIVEHGLRQKILHFARFPIGKDGLGVKAGSQRPSVRDANAGLAREDDRSCKRSSTATRPVWVKPLPVGSVRVQFAEPAINAVAQDFRTATKRTVGVPLVENLIQIERATRQWHQVGSLELPDQAIDVVRRTMAGKQTDVVFNQRL